MKILTIFLWKSGPLDPNHINLAALGESLGQRLLELTMATSRVPQPLLEVPLKMPPPHLVDSPEETLLGQSRRVTAV